MNYLSIDKIIIIKYLSIEKIILQIRILEPFQNLLHNSQARYWHIFCYLPSHQELQCHDLDDENSYCTNRCTKQALMKVMTQRVWKHEEQFIPWNQGSELLLETNGCKLASISMKDQMNKFLTMFAEGPFENNVNRRQREGRQQKVRGKW